MYDSTCRDEATEAGAVGAHTPHRDHDVLRELTALRRERSGLARRMKADKRLRPWQVEHEARLNAIKVILNAVDYKGRDPDMDFTPDPRIVVHGTQEVALMRAELRQSGRYTG